MTPQSTRPARTPHARMSPSRLACFRARVSGGTDGCFGSVKAPAPTLFFFFFFNCCHLSAQCARTVALTGPPPPHVPSLARRGAPARLRHQCLRRTTGTDLCRAAHAPGGGGGRSERLRGRAAGRAFRAGGVRRGGACRAMSARSRGGARRVGVSWSLGRVALRGWVGSSVRRKGAWRSRACAILFCLRKASVFPNTRPGHTLRGSAPERRALCGEAALKAPRGGAHGRERRECSAGERSKLVPSRNV